MEIFANSIFEWTTFVSKKHRKTQRGKTSTTATRRESSKEQQMASYSQAHSSKEHSSNSHSGNRQHFQESQHIRAQQQSKFAAARIGASTSAEKRTGAATSAAAKSTQQQTTLELSTVSGEKWKAIHEKQSRETICL